MAHNLNFNEQRQEWSFFSTEKAWHDLGQIVNGAKTSEEAIKLAHLDYEVQLKPIYFDKEAAFNEQDSLMPKLITDNYATVRTDTMQALGIVKKRYKVIQNTDVFSFFDNVIDDDDAVFETAGALGNGEKIFISAKMPHHIEIKGYNDPTEIYILLTSSHDGSGSIVAGITPIRVVCNNTLNVALGGIKNKVSIRHTINAKNSLKEAHKLMGITNLYIENMNIIFNKMNKTYIPDNVAKKLIEQVFKSEKIDSTRIKNIREDVWKSYQIGIGQEKITGTAYGLFNGISFYLSHKNYNSNESKFKNLYLTEKNKLQESFNLIIKSL
jgi:phage/plasmid-like protein (TIGR03299 family)